MRSVYARAGVAPDDLAFFEMHGTGTPAGDPIEAAAVGHALGQSRSDPLPIGSVKTNIGHLEPASGMAGLLKAALALDRGIVPPTLHCETPNPNIPFDELNLRLVRDIEPIAVARERRYAGVNSFGFGGTNAHVVLAARAIPGETARPADNHAPSGHLGTDRSIAARARAELAHHARRNARRAGARAAAGGRPRARPASAPAGRARAGSGGDRRMLAEFLDGEPAPAVITGTAVREGSSPLCSRETARNSRAWGATRCAPTRLSALRSRMSTGCSGRSSAGR